MNRNLIFLDVETNGLDVERHDAWEIAWWNLTTGERGHFLPLLSNGPSQFLAAASLPALRVNRFVDRWQDLIDGGMGYGQSNTSAMLFQLADQIAGTTFDHRPAVMVCTHPQFDLSFVSKLLARFDFEPEPWHHRAIDLGSFACGALGLDPADPPSGALVAELCGVVAPDHTAVGDVTSGGTAFNHLRAVAARQITGA